MITVRCPICDRLMEGAGRDWPEFPFCSERCKLVDLGRWLKGAYRLPDPEPAADGIDEPTERETP